MSEWCYSLLDVFAGTRFAGNQLAVFGPEAMVPEAMMGPIARELNLAETVFVGARGEDGCWPVRYFTTQKEIGFAGHPTLGAAMVLAPEGGTVRLETGKGIVTVEVEVVGPRVFRGVMMQPEAIVEEFRAVDELLAGLRGMGSEWPVGVYENGFRHAFVGLQDSAAVKAVRPDWGRLEGLGLDTISCFARRGAEWHTRVFVPGDAVPEDPATGSAAGALAVHLARYGVIALDEEISIAQGEEVGRPSRLWARPDGRVRGEGVVVGGGFFYS